MIIANFSGMILASAEVPTIVSPVDALYLALIGLALVFAVLAVLMFVIWLTGSIMVNSPKIAAKHPKIFESVKNAKAKMHYTSKQKKIEQSNALEGAPVAPILASGTFGELRLINTSDRDAAMLMAIVCDTLETPLNELRFVSIKNINEGECK